MTKAAEHARRPSYSNHTLYLILYENRSGIIYDYTVYVCFQCNGTGNFDGPETQFWIGISGSVIMSNALPLIQI